MEPITIIVGIISLILGSVISFFLIKNANISKSNIILEDVKRAEKIKKERSYKQKKKNLLS